MIGGTIRPTRASLAHRRATETPLAVGMVVNGGGRRRTRDGIEENAPIFSVTLTARRLELHFRRLQSRVLGASDVPLTQAHSRDSWAVCAPGSALISLVMWICGTSKILVKTEGRTPIASGKSFPKLIVRVALLAQRKIGGFSTVNLGVKGETVETVFVRLVLQVSIKVISNPSIGHFVSDFLTKTRSLPLHK
jgi:hypothetical protein